MAMYFYGYSKKTRDGFSILFHSATVALVAVLICIISFAKGGKFSYESTKGFSWLWLQIYKMTPISKSKVSSFHRKLLK